MVIVEGIDIRRATLDEDLACIVRLVHPQQRVSDSLEIRIRDRPER